MKNKLSLRASLTGSIFLDDVHVPQDSLLPKVKGLGGPFACLNSARSGSFRFVGCLNINIDAHTRKSGSGFPGEPWARWKTASSVHARMP